MLMMRSPASPVPNRLRASFRFAVVAALPLLTPAPVAAVGPTDARPYDARLMKLAEILGTLHYLRELCGAGEGQAWRDRMRELIEADGSTPLRRVQLTRAFNEGYATFSRSYRACTPTARATVTRLVQEGAQIADQLAKSSP